MHPNVKAFLDTIAMSELGPAILAASDNGYNVLVGSTPTNIVTFSSYADHPRVMAPMVIKGTRLSSTAAGRYQILMRYFDSYKRSLSLPDFGKVSQDMIAIQLIGECHAIGLIEHGDFAAAVDACKSRWASLPGANYGQNEHKLSYLQDAYLAAGGRLA